jgi:tetratricopeptide (TPR) repeat protein
MNNPPPSSLPGSGGRPSSPGVLLNFEGLAELLAFQGNPVAAREAFESGLRSCSKPSPRFLRQFALLEKRLGNFDAASELYRRAAQREPQDPKTWLQWGVMERRRRHFEAAEACFRRGVTAAPSHPHLW